MVLTGKVKVIAGVVPVPLSKIDWLGEVALRLLSSSVRLSLSKVFVVGVKSMGSVQEAFAARVVEEEQTWPPVAASGKSLGALMLEKLAGRCRHSSPSLSADYRRW